MALGLLPVPYAQALDGQEGVTTETLSGIDDDRPESQGGYDPGVRSCFTTWHKAYPEIPPGNMSFYIEEQGPVAAWCQAVRLFATAARAAGRDLDRRTFVTAMAGITGYPGTWSPVLSFGPGQALRPDRVPSGTAARQLAPLLAVQDAEEPGTPVHLLGERATVRAVAGRLSPPAPAARLRRWYTNGMEGPRLDADRRARWHEDGWCVLERFLPAEAVAAARADIGGLFPAPERVAEQLEAGRAGIDLRWDTAKPVFPFEVQSLNRLALHDSLISLAEDLLGTDRVRMYQGIASAKYSGGAPDYEQLLHVDYGNHTLVVPRAEVGYQHLELFVYLSDVDPGTAATRFVSRRLTGGIPVERTYLHLAEYASLYEAEVPASGPAGSVLAYRSDVYHRGTSLRDEGAARFLLHVSFKPVATDWIGYQAWPFHAEGAAWHRFVGQATPRQLVALGFPEPGHPYWNEETLDGVAARYPRLDMTPWRQARATAGAGR